MGHRFGFAEDTVRLAAALRPALARAGSPTGSMSTTARAFVDAWLLRACAKLGIRLIHSTPGRPQGRGKIERYFRTVREQFLVEITGTPPTGRARAGTRSPTCGELNALFTAWVESVYHRRVHSETGQAAAGPLAAPPGPSRPDPGRAGRGVPLGRVAHRHQDRDGVAARQHLPGRPGCWPGAGSSWCSTRSTSPHPGAPPRRPGRDRRCRTRSAATPTPKPAPNPDPPPAPTGIDYLRLVDDAHHPQVAAADRIGFTTPARPPADTRPASCPASSPHRPPSPTPARPRSRDAPATTRQRGPSVAHRRGCKRLTSDSPASRSAATSAPAMLHRHAGHAEAVARIGWCIDRARARGDHRRGRRRQDRRRPRRARRPGPVPAHRHLPAQPAVGARGIYHHDRRRARAGAPLPHTPPWSRRPSTPSPPRHAERGRTAVVVIDEAHLLCRRPARGTAAAHLMPSPRLCRGDHGGERIALPGEGRPSRPLGITAARGSKARLAGSVGLPRGRRS